MEGNGRKLLAAAKGLYNSWLASVYTRTLACLPRCQLTFSSQNSR